MENYNNIIKYIQSLKKGGDIYIKPANIGRFTATKKSTGKSTEELTHSKNPLTKKMAIFSQNSKKWKHGEGGEIGMTGMMKARLALANEFGNKTAHRLTGKDSKDYTFNGKDVEQIKNHYPDSKVYIGEKGNVMMGSYDNFATPSIQEINGKLEYIDKPWKENSDRSYNQSIKFDRQKDAEYFGNHYKEIAPVMRDWNINHYAKGGNVFAIGGNLYGGLGQSKVFTQPSDNTQVATKPVFDNFNQLQEINRRKAIALQQEKMQRTQGTLTQAIPVNKHNSLKRVYDATVGAAKRSNTVNRDVVNAIEDFIPGYGDVKGLKESADVWKENGPLAGFISTGLAGLGFLPVAGDLAKNVGKRLFKRELSTVAEKGLSKFNSSVDDIGKGLSNQLPEPPHEILLNQPSNFIENVNLQRQGIKLKRKMPSFDDVDLGNDLTLRNNPSRVANKEDILGKTNALVSVRNKKTGEGIDLKSWKNEDGEIYYYMSANMPSSKIKAGRAYMELEKHIPVGKSLLENSSLSYDSFLNILKQTKNPKFETFVKGKIPLNNSAKNNSFKIKPRESASLTEFAHKSHADAAVAELNLLLDKHNLPKANVTNEYGNYSIEIPNIGLKKLYSILGIVGTGAALQNKQ